MLVHILSLMPYHLDEIALWILVTLLQPTMSNQTIPLVLGIATILKDRLSTVHPGLQLSMLHHEAPLSMTELEDLKAQYMTRTDPAGKAASFIAYPPPQGGVEVTYLPIVAGQGTTQI